MYIRAYSSTWPSRLTRERERGDDCVCVCVCACVFVCNKIYNGVFLGKPSTELNG